MGIGDLRKELMEDFLVMLFFFGQGLYIVGCGVLGLRVGAHLLLILGGLGQPNPNLVAVGLLEHLGAVVAAYLVVLRDVLPG